MQTWLTASCHHRARSAQPTIPFTKYRCLIPIIISSLRPGAILTEDFDATGEVCCHNDVAVLMTRSCNIRCRFSRLLKLAIVLCWSALYAAVLGSRPRRALTSTSTLCSFLSAHEGDWWRIAEVIQRVLRLSQQNPCLGWCKANNSCNGVMSFEHLHWSLVTLLRF